MEGWGSLKRQVLVLAILLALTGVVVWWRRSSRVEAVQRSAYAVVLTNGAYANAAVVLGASLDATSVIQRTRIALVTDGVAAADRELLRGHGWRIREVDPVANPQPVEALAQARFRDTFTKLRVWELEADGFDLVVLLDADMVARESLDRLFGSHAWEAGPSGAEVAAAADCCDYFNSGLMVLRPSVATFKDMMRRVGHPDYASYDGGDQGFLNAYFEGRWSRLPYRYNSDQLAWLHNSRVFDPASAAVLHYVKVKPWVVGRTPDAAALPPIDERDPADVRADVLKFHAFWWDVADTTRLNLDA